MADVDREGKTVPPTTPPQDRPRGPIATSIFTIVDAEILAAFFLGVMTNDTWILLKKVIARNTTNRTKRRKYLPKDKRLQVLAASAIAEWTTYRLTSGAFEDHDEGRSKL